MNNSKSKLHSFSIVLSLLMMVSSLFLVSTKAQASEIKVSDWLSPRSTTVDLIYNNTGYDSYYLIQAVKGYNYNAKFLLNKSDGSFVSASPYDTDLEGRGTKKVVSTRFINGRPNVTYKLVPTTVCNYGTKFSANVTVQY